MSTTEFYFHDQCCAWEDDNTAEVLFNLWYHPDSSSPLVYINPHIFENVALDAYLRSQKFVEAVASGETCARSVVSSDSDGSIGRILHRIACSLDRAYHFRFETKSGPMIDSVLAAYRANRLARPRHARKDMKLAGHIPAWTGSGGRRRGDPLTHTEFPEVFDSDTWKLIETFNSIRRGEPQIITRDDLKTFRAILKAEIRW